MTAPARSRRATRSTRAARRRSSGSGGADAGGAPRDREERYARPPLRIAFRMAARMARRSLGRSILVAVMIAVPVSGMAGTVVINSSMQPTSEELVELQLGAEAEAVLQVVAPPDSGVRQDAAAPAQGWWDTYTAAEGELVDPTNFVDGDLIVESFAAVVLRTPNGIRQVPALEGDLLQPELAGRFDLLEGESPSRAGEVAVTPALLESLDARLGDTAIFVTGDRDMSLDIVGLYSSSETSRATQEILLYPGVLPEGTAQPNRFYLLDQQLSWTDVLALNERGIIAASRSVILGDGPTPGARASDLNAFGYSGGSLAIAALIGGFLMMQVVLLAAAAFMVGARQQQRALAVLASVGGDRRLMRATVTAGGIVLGLVGGLIGVGFGIAGAAAAIPLLSDGRALSFPGFHVDPLPLLVVLAAAVLAGWAAAAVPARIASRVDVVSALRGARRPAPPRRATRVLSVTVIIGGLALLAIGGIVLVVVRTLDTYPPEADAIAIASIGMGGVIVQLGLVLQLPAILRLLARATGRARTPLRLAARDAGRNSARTVPVTAAVMTTVFLSTFIMSMLSAAQQETNDTYRTSYPANLVAVSVLVYDPIAETEGTFDNVDGVRAAIQDIAPSARTAIVASSPGEPQFSYDSVTGDPSLLSQSEGTTIAQVFPADEQCRDVTASAVAGEPGGCAAPRDDLQDLTFGSAIRGDIAIGAVEDLQLFSGMTFTDDARRTLDGGGAVALSPLLVDDGEVAIDRFAAEAFLGDRGGAPNLASVDPESTDTLPAVVQTPEGLPPARILILPSTAERIGLEVRTELVIAQLDSPPTLAQRDAVTAISQELTGDPYRLYTYFETGPPDTSTLGTWALVAISAVIALAASSIAIGLARIDGRRDEAILGAMGATRSLRRAVSLWQAILLAGVGSLIGAGLGVLTAGALALPGGPMPFAPPLLQLVIVAVGVPLLIGVGAWLLAGRSTALPTDRTAIS